MTKYAGREITLEIEGTTVGQCTSIGEVGSVQELIDASAYGDDWKDYVLGQQDGVEVEVTCALDPANTGQDALIAAQDGTAHTFTLAHPVTGFHLDFEALVTTITRGGERDGLLQLSATLKIVNPGVTDAS